MGRWLNHYIPLVREDRSILNIGREGFDPLELEEFRSELNCHREIVLEFGSGSGGHLLAQAERHPEILFVGFELRFKRAFRTIEKANQRGISNVRIVRADARLFPLLLEDKLVSGVYVNFPDPWAKDRWKKHRLLNHEFLHQLAAHLADEAFLSFKTDHSEYFAEVSGLLRQLPDFTVDCETSDLFHSDFGKESVPTEFESLFRSHGLPISFLQATRIRRNLQSAV